VLVVTAKGLHMIEAHNGAVVASQVSATRRTHRDTHLLWGILIAVIGLAGIAAVVVTAMMGLTTEAIIIAIFTGAFFSRCAC
jgi:hypothetical protein